MKANSMSSYISKPLPLGSIVSINPESIGKGYANLKIDYVDISSVGSGTLNGTTVYKISKAPSRAKRLISHGDTILSTVRPNRRSFLFIKNPSPYMVVSTGFAVLRPSEKIDPRFLYYTVTNQPFTDYLTANAKGAAYPAVDTEIIARAKINLPSLPTQREIAAILSAYDDLIENNTRRIQILEEMAQALYREWFVEFRFPGHEKVKMVESELGMVPDGWEIRKLGDIAREIRRSVKPDQINPETPYVGLQHIPRKSIALSEWGMASEVKSTKLSFEVGEILFGKIRPYFHKVAVAPIDGVCSTDTIVISPKDAKLFSIVLACVSSEEFVSHATQTSQGTKMPRADWKVLIKYPVAIPPLPLLIRFDEFIKDVLNQIQNMIFRNKNLRSTRDLLLPKFISGEVSVDNFNINMGGIN
jgi:type I restriction enzyme S subunit